MSLSPLLAILAKRGESTHRNHVNGSLKAFFVAKYLDSISYINISNDLDGKYSLRYNEFKEACTSCRYK